MSYHRLIHTPRGWGALLALAALLVTSTASSATSRPSSNEIAWFQLMMGLLGGLALFLYGMERMGDALKDVAGERLRSILGRLSNNRVMGFFTGLGVTAVIQSSSVTTVMLVGFVSAELMSFGQSLGVILGAHVGTTVTAQIVAFKVTKYALLLVALGFMALFVSKQQRVQRYGYMVMGLGLIFFGMAVMSDAMRPLRSFQPFLKTMQSIESPLQGILLAAAFTALIQSSSATMGIVIVLAMQGLISLEAGIALALGANIGTCATAGLASIGKPREAVRVAVAHVLIKVVGVALIFPFISQFAELITWLSPASSDLSGVALRAAVVPRQVANAHTLFSLAVALLFLPFTGYFAHVVTWFIKDRPLEEEERIIENKYLDRLLLDTPSLAMGAVRHEIGRVGKRVLRMLERIPEPLIDGTEGDLLEVQKLDEEVDELYGQIVVYLGLISRRRLRATQTTELMGLMSAANDLETVGDIIETELVAAGLRRIEDGVTISDATRERIMSFHAHVYEALRVAVRAVTDADTVLAESVLSSKAEIKAEQAATSAHQVERLVADEPNRLEAYAVEMDLLDRMARIHYHSRRLAKSILNPSRLVHQPSLEMDPV